MHSYRYQVEICDVPEVRRKALLEYRNFRLKCLEYIRSEADTSVSTQLSRLAWYTAVFKTLNKARAIESTRAVNGPMWDLVVTGYSTIVTLGVRRLVDDDRRVDSVRNVLTQLKKRPELLRRENYVCFDGVPYDGSEACSRHFSRLGVTDAYAVGTLEERASIERDSDWGMAEILHKAFDRLAGHPIKRSRNDAVSASLIDSMISRIDSPAIKRVCHLADRKFAHAERIKADNPVPVTTLDDIDEALETLFRVTNFLSSSIFQDAHFVRVVPVPQYNVLAGLDEPWISKAMLPELRRQWDETCRAMDDWATDCNAGFVAS